LHGFVSSTLKAVFVNKRQINPAKPSPEFSVKCLPELFWPFCVAGVFIISMKPILN